MNIRNTLYAGAAVSLTLMAALRASPSLAQTTAPPAPPPAASERGPGDGPEPYYRNSLAGQAWRMAHAEARADAPAPPVAAPPSPQSIALSRKVVEAAAVFLHYVDNASDLDADLADGEEVAASVEEGSAYEAHQLAEGAVAYAALVALQDPGFVEGVRSLAADRAARRPTWRRAFSPARRQQRIFPARGRPARGAASPWRAGARTCRPPGGSSASRPMTCSIRPGRGCS
jgi:hypothetical protein